MKKQIRPSVHPIVKKIRNFKAYVNQKCNRPEIMAACILDTFSYECFRYECSMEQLHAETWEEQMIRLKPDLLLVESAWKGVNDSWTRKICEIETKPDSPVWKLLKYCKKKRIAAIFWNKEDPVHYDRFIATAKLFDVVFTTDQNCLKRYKLDLGHERIYILPFAAQPAIHNPVNSDYHSKGNVAFAGTWYGNKYPERQMDMALIFDFCKKFNLHIFDRQFDSKAKKNYKFPIKYRSNIAGGLAYTDMVKAYKLYKVFLNVNSVKDSPTMFSRRVFEILASGTNIISSYSKGIEEMFSGIVPIISTKEEIRKYLSIMLNDPEYSQRLSLQGVREVYGKHLYKYRFATILEKIGINEKSKQGISVIACVDQSRLTDPVLESFLRQAWEDKELIILLFHERPNLWMRLRSLLRHPNIKIYHITKDSLVSDCLNESVNRAKYDLISIFNPRHFYSRYFLTDLMHAFEYTDAGIVGKHSHYVYNEHSQTLFIRSPFCENQFVNDLPCSAMIVKREVFTKVKFSETRDDPCKQFIMNCTESGIRMYSADKYNYVCIEGDDDNNSHSESGEDKHLDETSAIPYVTDYRTYVTV